MQPAEVVHEFRRQIDDLAEPYLWGDEEAYSYLDDAQKMFCRLTEGIEDSRTARVCRLEIKPGVEWYEKSPLILKLRSATRLDTGMPVQVLSPENAAEQGLRFIANRTGCLHALVDGQTRGFLRAFPMPNEAVSVELAVFRLPLRTVCADGPSLEIDSQHHRHLILWMRHLAYGKQDADTFDPKNAERYEGLFRDYCARARVEQERGRRQTGMVAYGGI